MEKLFRRVREAYGDLALIVTVSVHFPDARVLIREPVSEQFPFADHFCFPREFVLKTELVLTVVDGLNAVTFHLAVGLVAATTVWGGTSDDTEATTTSNVRAVRRNRLFIQISLALQLLRESQPHR
jgi:hypothetical protein